MNKTQTIINIVFAVAIVVLCILVFAFRSGKASTSESAAIPVAEGTQMPIAYLNVDSLLANYTFAQEAQEKLMSKQEDARLKLNQNARTLQSEMADFQKKYENNAFLSAERAQSEYQRLQKKQQDLEELENKLAQDIMMENQKLNIQLSDSLSAFLKDYNADGRYQIIMSNNAKDNILMAADIYDITNEIVSGMNARYKK
ncbi:MAG: OmpH family outer membrane protein [Paludibacteraceae bacterium]|nr:OmpH family outer membrane protein [Paludibacteraceae bacterium]